MDAHSFLFPPTTGATKKMNGKAATVEPLRTQIMFDARAGDILHLEDESGRVELETDDDTVSIVVGNKYKLDPNTLVTGVVIAVVGRVDGARGVMKVRSVHFAGPPRSSPSSSSTTDDSDITPRGRGVLRGPTTIHDTIDGDAMEGDEEDDGPYLLLISGLGCGADSPTDLECGTSLAVRREMLLEYLTNPTLSDGSSICRVIVAGGGVASPVIDDGEDDDQDGVDGGGGGGETNGNKRKNYNIEASAKSSSIKTKTTDAANRVASSLAELDIYLSEILACGIPVDYVPGYHDPTNANWPQRPLHPCLLPRSCGYVDLFGRGTNPYECIIGCDEKEAGSYVGVRVLGSDGLNVADLRRFLATTKKDVVATTTDDNNYDVAVEAAGVPSSIDAINRTLVYGHVAPTGPDSLPTFPSLECDPFVLSSRPDVYFAGNCDKFETRLVDSRGNAINDTTVLASGTDDESAMTRLVCVPSFSLTGEVVLVKLKTLECEVMSFNDSML
jgi:DNA polymerase delta subunit 2